MMIQNKVRLLKRPFRVLLSLALIGGICGAPAMAADKSSRKSSSSNDRSSSKRSSSRASHSKSLSRSSSSRSQSSRPKSSSLSKSRPSRNVFKNISDKSTPKVINRGSSKSKSKPSFKVAPKTTRPGTRLPHFGKTSGLKFDTKDRKPRVPNRKVPDRKIPNVKIPDRKPNTGKFVPKPGKQTRPSKPGSNNVFKPGKGTFVPKPGKNTTRPKPGKGNNNVFKPGKGNFVPKPGHGNNNVFKPGKGKFDPKPGKGNRIPPIKDISRGDSVKKPGKTRYPGVFDPSKLKDLSKGNGKRKGPGHKWLGKNGVPLKKDLFKDKNIKPIRPSLEKQLKVGKLNTLIHSKKAKHWNMKKQFELHKKGDVARQLHLHKNLLKHGGWRNRSLFGKMANSFTTTHFGAWYAGPGFYPSYCWSPHWSAWVDWCWWDWCHPICDPRPIICRPIICDPCAPWGWYECPIWQPLPIVTCGTWIDVEPIVIDAGLDLQMLAVRFVDSGHPEQELGPRFRVWFRNNSDVDINAPFNVMLLASNSRELEAGVPEAGSRVDNIAAGQIQSVDIRLPFAASQMSIDEEGNQLPFEQLHVLIDSHREIPEAFEENNGAVMARVDVLPVDPALFSTDTDVVVSGTLVNLAGEGLGPEPGKVLVSLNGMNFEAEIYGWYDLGVQVKMPELPLLDVAEANLVVVRGDGAVSNPVDVEFAPQVAAVIVE
ncbi:hypothetical protein [Gimesia fumaroli]|nr:hypothetical protein [Gimesia fumaroli]